MCDRLLFEDSSTAIRYIYTYIYLLCIILMYPIVTGMLSTIFLIFILYVLVSSIYHMNSICC